LGGGGEEGAEKELEAFTFGYIVSGCGRQRNLKYNLVNLFNANTWIIKTTIRNVSY
jgi:hypothetical protein